MVSCCRSIRAKEYIFELILILICALEYIAFHYTAECIFFQEFVGMGNFLAVGCGEFHFAAILERNFFYVIDKSTVKCVWISFISISGRTYGSLQCLYCLLCCAGTDNGCRVIIPVLIISDVK